ncbi:MAG: VOC family protein, partial [Candidatus Binatia bacterium]
MAHGPPVIESISAVTLVVTDMARSVAFYRRLGFELRYGGEDASFTSFRAGPGFLNLERSAEETPAGDRW